MVFHIAATLKSFATRRHKANVIFRRIVNPLDVVLEIVRSVCGKRAELALLSLQICVRQLVLAEKKLGEVSLRTFVTCKALLFERILLTVRHRAMLLEADNVAESSLTIGAFVLLAPNVIVEMRYQSNLCVEQRSTTIALKRNVCLLRNVDRLE